MEQELVMLDKKQPEEERCENLKRVWEDIMKLDGMAIIIRQKGEPEKILQKWIMKNWSILDNYKRVVQGKDIAMAKVKLNGCRKWTYVLVLKKEVMT
jgi:hypothetical protein